MAGLGCFGLLLLLKIIVVLYVSCNVFVTGMFPSMLRWNQLQYKSLFIMWINSSVLMLNMLVALENYSFLLSDEKIDNSRGVTFCWIKKEYSKYFMTFKGLSASKGSFICIMLFCFYIFWLWQFTNFARVLSKGAQCHYKIGTTSLMWKSLGFTSWQLNRHELYISVNIMLDISSVVEKLFILRWIYIRSVVEKLFLVRKFFFWERSCKYFLCCLRISMDFSEALCDHFQAKIKSWSQNSIFDV